jgi:hypothetical protein
VFVFHARQYHQFHKTLDKGGLSCSDGANHSNVDFSVGPGFDIIVYVIIVHKDSPFCAVTLYAGVKRLFPFLFNPVKDVFSGIYYFPVFFF